MVIHTDYSGFALRRGELETFKGQVARKYRRWCRIRKVPAWTWDEQLNMKFSAEERARHEEQ